jgi:hypothetical protein
LAGNPAPAPAAAPADSAAPPPAAGDAPAAAPAGSWVDAIADADLKGYAQNKGWKDPVEVLNGYRNLEKLVGQDKIPMPKGDADKDGWARVWDALGRPKSADDYRLAVPEGADPAFAKQAAGKFHELGLSASQASALADWWNQTQGSQQQQLATQRAQDAERGLTELRQAWGNDWDQNVELGRRAAREFGFNPDLLGKIEGAIGTKALLEQMAKIGRGLTEDRFTAGRGANSFGMTPEAARTRIADLRKDPTWSSKYLSGNVDAKAELARLMALAYPDG